MRVACVLATHLRAKVEMGRHRHLADRPVLIVDGDPSAARSLVVDHFPAAVGAREGMALEEAMSHHADAVVLDADESCYRQVFRRMVAALQQVSDRVEAADLGTAYARLDGLEGLYGSKAGVVAVQRHRRPRSRRRELSSQVVVITGRVSTWDGTVNVVATDLRAVSSDVVMPPSHDWH